MKDIKIYNMKKLILKLTYVIALFAFIQSCDDVERVYYNDAAETVLSLSDNNLTLSEDNGTNEILTLTSVSYTHLTLPTKRIV